MSSASTTTRRQPPSNGAGFTTADVARRYRVGQSKVLLWIKLGELTAINTSSAMCARPRYVVTADALEQFERRRSAKPVAKVQRRQRSAVVDHCPD